MAEMVKKIVDGRVGDWMCTFTGQQFWPLDPRPGEVHFEDVAHHLATENRFCGALPEPYSVAQHCYYASLIVEKHLGGSRQDQLWALFHDASEAYLKDIHRPLKRALYEYSGIERGVTAAIMDRFGLPHEMPAKVRTADELCLTIERRDLFPSSHKQLWVLGGEDRDLPPITFSFMPWKMAHTRFVGRYFQLTRGAGR